MSLLSAVIATLILFGICLGIGYLTTEFLKDHFPHLMTEDGRLPMPETFEPKRKKLIPRRNINNLRKPTMALVSRS